MSERQANTHRQYKHNKMKTHPHRFPLTFTRCGNTCRVNPDMRTHPHLTRLPASRHLHTHTHKFPRRAPGRGESSSSSEVERKPIGQIRFQRFLTELSINLQRCAVIRHDLGLSQRSVWECSERLLIRPGGHGAYDDITQPFISPHTSLCFS
ncbi:hypothetical protein ABVT39_002727, partial [Epinephelus coioides]